jgi:hypothetical protein
VLQIISADHQEQLRRMGSDNRRQAGENMFRAVALDAEIAEPHPGEQGVPAALEGDAVAQEGDKAGRGSASGSAAALIRKLHRGLSWSWAQ